jgi:hypothetical protein
MQPSQEDPEYVANDHQPTSLLPCNFRNACSWVRDSASRHVDLREEWKTTQLVNFWAHPEVDVGSTIQRALSDNVEELIMGAKLMLWLTTPKRG